MTRTARRQDRRAALARRRETVRADRAAARARRQVATGAPQTVKTHLLAAGVTVADARRFAGAFSRGVESVTTVRTTMRNPKGKYQGSRDLRVTVKLVDAAAFRARLTTYRPKSDPAAAARFAAVAA